MRLAVLEIVIELYRDERGVTTVEYALVTALIAVAVLAAALGLEQAGTNAMNRNKAYFEGGQ